MGHTNSFLPPARSRYRVELVGLAGLTLVWVYLRLPGLFFNSFQPDEALYATWARLIAVWRDPLLISQAVDKPPLLFYLQALFYPLQGPVEWAARLPNWIASILLIPLTGRWAGELVPASRRRPAVLIAAALLVFSPLAVQFSSTAFLDPLLTFWLVLSLYLAGRPGRSGRSGVALGLAVATKYQALLFFPLIALQIATSGRQVKPGWLWIRWLAGAAVPGALVVLWDLIRSGRFTLLTLQLGNYGGLRPVFSWELWPRLGQWLMIWFYTLGWGWLFLPLLLFLLLPFWSGRAIAPFVSWLVLFLAVYFALHWLLAVPIWDRYLLPSVPLVAGVTGAALAAAGDSKLGLQPHLRTRSSFLIGLFIGLLLLWQGMGGRAAAFPLGSTPRSDQGAARIARTLVEAPYGTVLYDHWYSWQWRYHLFDTGVYISWFAGPEDLQRELQVFGRDGHDHYLALPLARGGRPLLAAVRAAGFMAVEVARTEGIALYLLEPDT